ncbi:MAG TPA: CHAT domain-containing protein [Anaerolineae bacterium]
MDNHQLEYLDFELLVGFRRGQEYPVNVIRSPAGEVAHDVFMQFPFAALDLERFIDDLPFILIRSSRLPWQQVMSDEQRVRDFGRRLFHTLFAGKVGNLYWASQALAEQQGKGLRLKLRIRPPELVALPWEFLFDTNRDEYVCLSRNTPIVRYLEVERPIRSLEVEPPLRVLGMVANPKRMPQIDGTEERNYLTEALRDLCDRNLVELIWLEGQTWRDLQAAMRAGPWHIFHFVGHGSFRPGADEGAIILSDEAGQPYPLPASDFARLFVDHRSLRVVILNACQGARSSPRNAFSSTAATLVRHGLPAVLAMQYPLSDSAAVHFGRELYQALTGWLPIDAAVGEARKAVRMAGGESLEWGTPTLYMRAPNGMLFSPARKVEGLAARGLASRNSPWRRALTGREVEKAHVHTARRSCTPDGRPLPYLV